MTSTFHPGYNPLIRKQESIAPLSDEEKQALQELPVQVTVLKTDHPTLADLDAAQGWKSGNASPFGPEITWQFPRWLPRNPLYKSIIRSSFCPMAASWAHACDTTIGLPRPSVPSQPGPKA